MTTKAYTAEDIRVLSDRDHVRLRTQIYLGSTEPSGYFVPIFINGLEIKLTSFIPALYKAVGEIIDNSLDEFAQNKHKTHTLTISADPENGVYAIADNGRGIPIDLHETGRRTPEVALGSLRSGRNFEAELEAGVIGQNGVGSACTNFCSVVFTVEVMRDGKKYRQVFTKGASEVSEPTIKKTTKRETGTSIEFILDKEVFGDVSLPPELLENRAMEIALTNPGVVTEYNGTKYRYPNGFDDYIKTISKDYFKFNHPSLGEFFVVFDCFEGTEELIFTWVNSSMLFDGGLCNTQFVNAFCDKTAKHLESSAKKNRCEVTKQDVRRNLLVFGNLRISNPLYDAQSKTRLTGPNLRKEFGDMIDLMWTQFTKKNKEWFDVVLERAIIRHHATENKKAVKNHQKKLRKKVAGLMDATSTNRHNCQLLVTEGDSAAGMITDARDPETTASLPLTGKINNVYGTTIAQLLKMGKVADLITAIGLVPGQKAIRSTLNYGRVVVATDSDVDGGDIFTLLINLFYTFWPELFDPSYEPFIFRLIAPNICITKGKQRKHFPTRQQWETKKNTHKGWEVNYYKGLGSMVREDWNMILSGKTDTLIPILEDGKIKETLELLFSKDADRRKEWLQHR